MTEENAKLFYLLGCLTALLYNKVDIVLSPFLKELIKRRKLSWEAIKLIRTD